MKIEEKNEQKTFLKDLLIGEVFRLIRDNAQDKDEGINLRQGNIFLVIFDGVVDLNENDRFSDENELNPAKTEVVRLNAKLVVG